MDEALLGFSVAPSKDCPHIASDAFTIHGDLVPSGAGSEGKAARKNVFEQHRKCSECGEGEESWICLACAFSGCSRYKKGHMVLHSEAQSKNNGHDCIAVSVADLSFWCFSCDEYITHPKVEDVFRQVHWGKFGCLPSGELHGAAEGLSMTLVEDRDSGGEKDGKAG